MQLNKIFASHMVFPAGKILRFYGEGAGVVSISFAGLVKTEHFTRENWCVEFPPMEYGGPYNVEVTLDGEKIVLEDVYVGEVYLIAGQSNMQYKVQESPGLIDRCSANDKLRLFSTYRLEKGEYADYFTPEDGWKLCKSDEVGRWSAIAYLAGNQVSLKKNVAVGVIACYQGASVIESWVPKGTFEKLGINIPTEKRHVDHVHEVYIEWNGDGVLYEYAMKQVFPFALSGVVWYQGESDTTVEEAIVYVDELSEMIKIWREDFRDMSLKFIVVQIADFFARPDEGWSLIQKAQWDIQSVLPGVKTVISKDVCESDTIHPPTKDKLAERIAEALME